MTIFVEFGIKWKENPWTSTKSTMVPILFWIGDFKRWQILYNHYPFCIWICPLIPLSLLPSLTIDISQLVVWMLPDPFAYVEQTLRRGRHFCTVQKLCPCYMSKSCYILSNLKHFCQQHVQTLSIIYLDLEKITSLSNTNLTSLT